MSVGMENINQLETPEAIALLSAIKSLSPNSWAICTDGSVTTVSELRETLAVLIAFE